VSLLAWCLLGGCGEEGDPGIVGDWFYCMDSDCQTLDNDGIRFDVAGFWVTLRADGSTLDPMETYCERQESGQRGAYTWDGLTLSLSVSPGVKESSTFEVQGDLALKKWGVSYARRLRRLGAPRSSGACP